MPEPDDTTLTAAEPVRSSQAPVVTPLSSLAGATPIGNLPLVVNTLQDEVDAAKAGLQLVAEPAKPQLLSYLRDCFSDAENARRNSGVEEMLQECLRRRKGEHSADEKARLKKYEMPIVWYPHTRIMCERAESHIRDTVGDDYWSVEPFSLPTLNKFEETILRRDLAQATAFAQMQGQQVPSEDELQSILEDRKSAIVSQRKAKEVERAKRKRAFMADVLERSHYMRVMRTYWSNVVTFGTGFIAGPEGRIVRSRDENGLPVDRLIPVSEDFSPLDAYPAPWSIEVEDGYFFRRVLYTRNYLQSKISRPGRTPVRWWQGPEIASLLIDHPNGNISPLTPDPERADMERKDQGASDKRFDCRVHHGSISGALLTDWRIDNVDPTANYGVTAMMSGSNILLVRTNWDDMDRIPIVKSCFKRIPGSFFGEAMPIRIKFGQDEGNFTKTCAIAEMEWIGSPVRLLQQDRFVNPQDATSVHPGKFIAIKKPMPGDQSRPYEIIEQASHQQEYIMVFSRNKDEVDLLGAVPSSMQGSDKSSGVGRTFSGAAMMRSDALRGIKDTVMESDEHAIAPNLQMTADYITQYAKDLGFDDVDALSMRVAVQATGATGLILKEQKLDKVAQALDRIANPLAMAALGTAGPATYIGLLKQFVELMDLSMPELPSEQEIADNSVAIHQMVLDKVYHQMGVSGASAEPGQSPVGQVPMTQPGPTEPQPQGAAA